MTQAGWIRRHVKAFAALALLALLVRAIVPAGFMVAPTKGDLLTITLCSGHGAVEALLDLDTGAIVKKGQQKPEKPAASDAPCAFAVAAALSPPEAPFSLAVCHMPAVRAPVRLASATPGRGLAAPPPWSTGPPTSV